MNIIKLFSAKIIIILNQKNNDLVIPQSKLFRYYYINNMDYKILTTDMINKSFNIDQFDIHMLIGLNKHHILERLIHVYKNKLNKYMFAILKVLIANKNYLCIPIINSVDIMSANAGDNLANLIYDNFAIHKYEYIMNAQLLLFILIIISKHFNRDNVQCTLRLKFILSNLLKNLTITDIINDIYKPLNTHHNFTNHLQTNKNITSEYEFIKYILSEYNYINPLNIKHVAYKKLICMPDIEILKLLIKYNFDMSFSENYAIRTLSCINDYKIIELLLSIDNVDPTVNDNISILNAIDCGNLQIINAMLTHKRVIPSNICITTHMLYKNPKLIIDLDKIYKFKSFPEVIHIERYDNYDKNIIEYIHYFKNIHGCKIGPFKCPFYDIMDINTLSVLYKICDIFYGVAEMTKFLKSLVTMNIDNYIFKQFQLKLQHKKKFIDILCFTCGSPSKKMDYCNMLHTMLINGESIDMIDISRIRNKYIFAMLINFDLSSKIDKSKLIHSFIHHLVTHNDMTIYRTEVKNYINKYISCICFCHIIPLNICNNIWMDLFRCIDIKIIFSKIKCSKCIQYIIDSPYIKMQ